MNTIFRDRRAGLSALEALLVCLSLFVVGGMIYKWNTTRLDNNARTGIPESIRAGDTEKLLRGLRTSTDADLSIPEEWTNPDETIITMRYSLLAYAVKHQKPGAVNALLEFGSEIDGKVWGNRRQPLFWAAYNQDQAMYDLLVGAGAATDAIVENKTALGHATEGYPDAVEFLKANGVEH